LYQVVTARLSAARYQFFLHQKGPLRLGKNTKSLLQNDLETLAQNLLFTLQQLLKGARSGSEESVELQTQRQS
jgi:hypothetical protein